MKIKNNKPPRTFKTGSIRKVTISHMANLEMESDEQITFVDKNRNEYDVVKKRWGYYATPSVNDRLKRNNYKTAIVKNKKRQVYVMLVHKNKITLFNKYLKTHENKVLYWLDEK